MQIKSWSNTGLKVLLSLIIGLAIFAVNTHTAHAYYLFGGRWANQPTSGCCAHLYVVHDSSMSSQSDADWTNGENVWTGSIANVVFINDGNSSNPIYLTETNRNDVGWDGTTVLFSGPNLTGTQCGDFMCSTYQSGGSILNLYYTAQYNDSNERRSVTAHELGHILGLAHNNNSSCFLMYWSTYRYTGCSISTPQVDDENGVNALY